MGLPPGVKAAKCKSCGAPIFWASTQRGKLMPVDALPTPDGNLAAFIRGGVVMVAQWGDGHKACARRTSHFSTCPRAEEHRR